MNWKRGLTCALLMAVGVSALPGCATIASDRKYQVMFENDGGPTQFSVRDHKNEMVHQGVTPQQVTLKAKSYPFWPARYGVTFVGQGDVVEQREIKAGFDPWLLGNVVLGGVPGLLVDGFTGAMFRLPKQLSGEIPTQYVSTGNGASHQSIAGQQPAGGNIQQANYGEPPAPQATGSAATGSVQPAVYQR